MSDLCERLRRWEERTYGPCGKQVRVTEETLHEAADHIEAQQAEIDRLRAELEEARRNLKLRDNFIVARGRSMWNDFVDVLPKRTSGND